MTFLLLLTFAVLILTFGLRLVWRWVPAYFLFLGNGLAFHLLLIVAADPSEKKRHAFVTVFWGGIYLMCVLALFLRSLGKNPEMPYSALRNPHAAVPLASVV